MQQFVRREAATNAGAKKYFNAAPARMQRFFSQIYMPPTVCLYMRMTSGCVFVCVAEKGERQVHV